MDDMSDYLHCKICNRAFPMYDQRGFRNAGFTAHQNRCIEREYLSNSPNRELQKNKVVRHRTLLPAPSPPRHNLMSKALLSEWNAIEYQPRKDCDSQQHTIKSTPEKSSLTCNRNSTSMYDPEELLAPTHFSTFDILGSSSSTAEVQVPSERQFPIVHCDFCIPEFGLHRALCPLLAIIVSQDD